MALVNNAGVRIHYEVEGSGPPITLMHGMGGSIDNWVRTGYVDALKDELRLILIDARGFGESDKPHDPESYTREAKVSDVVAVLDDLGIERAHYWGYSMGASNGWAMGMLRPDRLVSLVLGGYPALPSPASERDRVKWESRAKLMRLGMDVYIAAMEMDRGPMPEENKRRLMANDGHAYAAQQLANITWGTPESAVRAMTVPALVSLVPTTTTRYPATMRWRSTRLRSPRTLPSCRYPDSITLKRSRTARRSSLTSASSSPPSTSFS